MVDKGIKGLRKHPYRDLASIPAFGVGGMKQCPKTAKQLTATIADLRGVLRINTSLAVKIYRVADTRRLHSLSRTQLAALNALILKGLAIAEISRGARTLKTKVRRQFIRLIQIDSLVFRREAAQPLLGYPYNCIR